MKIAPIKPTKRTDWANYIDADDRVRIREERRYRISSRLDAVVDRKGEVALALHDGPDYVGDTILSKVAMAKLAYVLKAAEKRTR